MAKAPAKKTSPMLWVGLAAIGVAAYVMTAPDSSPKTTAKLTAGKSASKLVQVSMYQPQDYKVGPATFASLNDKPVDAFKPLVIRNSGQSGNLGVGGFPADIGGPGWAYSGMAGINGVDTGILENATTGEHDFVTNGQHWKTAVVNGIYIDHIDLVTPDKVYKVYTDTKDESAKPQTAPTIAPGMLPAVAPLAMQGQIGANGVGATTDAATSAATIGAVGAPGGFGGRGGRSGRRRNRGGN